MKTFQLWDYDRGEGAEREAKSPMEAIEIYAIETDDGAEHTDLGVMDGRGEWRRYRVRYDRRVDVTLERGRVVDDPRTTDEE